MEKIKITNSKGENLSAIINRPKIKTDKLAILCPGFLDTKDYAHLVELAETLAGVGYTVVRFDPTGTWESEGDISEYTTTQYLEDIKSVLDFMLREGNYGHVLLGGHSRGGMVSILYASRDRRISVVLGIMPSSPLTFTAQKREEWQKAGISIASRDIPGETNRREFQVPFSHVVDRDKYSSLEDVSKINVPVILVAGELDSIARPELVRMIFDRANEPKTYILIKDIGHDYRQNLDEIKLVNSKIIEALSRVY